MRRLATASLIAAALASVPAPAHSQIGIIWELGMAFPARIDAAVPGSGGTRFSFVEDLEQEATFAQRIKVGYAINGRHQISLLVAPSKFEPEGEFESAVLFQEVSFVPGALTLGVYEQNAWRLSYRYRTAVSSAFLVGVGAAAALRDAHLSLRNAQEGASKSKIDFLPMLSGDLRLLVGGSMSLLADIEGGFLPGSRTIDLLGAVDFEPADRFRFRLGYRMTGNFLDGDDLYYRSLVHHGVIGITLII